MPNSGKTKRLAKLFVSMGCFVIQSIREGLYRLVSAKRSGTCVVLYYHSVFPEHRDRFARQMDELIRWTKPLRADENTPLEIGKRYAVVTFDDGFLNVFDNALPELEQRSVPSTVFVIVDKIGGTADWDRNLPSNHGDEKIVFVDRLRGIASDLVTIGSHTVTHPVLLGLEEDEAWVEISRSRTKLQSLLNQEITLFSFPYGGFNDQLLDMCRNAGYDRVFTTLPHLALLDPQEFVTGRIRCEPTDWLLEFRLKLLGAYRWLPFAHALKRKLQKVIRIRD